MRHEVDRPSTVKDVLAEQFPDSSGRTRKQLVVSGRVRVNGQVVRITTTALAAGDVVEVSTRRGGAGRAALELEGLTVVHEDEDLIVIDKSAGWLTVATAKERERTAYRVLWNHVKARAPRARVFIVHRLDRLASGLLVFAKTLAAKKALQAQMRSHAIERVYVALCSGRPEESQGVICSSLRESQSGRVYEVKAVKPSDRGEAGGEAGAGAGEAAGKSATTHWRVLRAGEPTSLIELRLETGRKHQIRVHLASIGHPICGDPMYGDGQDPLGRLALHARSLAFAHPRDDERVQFDAPIAW